ncbi:MAG: FkbM family methyltransferase [Flavobacteriales bacterium]
MNYWGGANVRDSGELFLMNFLKDQLKDKTAPVMFDVGANLGQYLSYLSKYFPNADIHCFEPSKFTFEKLEQTRKNLPNQENIYLHFHGFGSVEESKTLFLSNYLAATASVYDGVVEGSKEESQISETISIKTIDGFCKENGILSIDFLKIDVEGHELQVLNGAKHMIEYGGIAHIQFEFTKCNIESKSFFKDFYDLLDEKYSLYRMLPSGMREVKKYENHLEVFAEANFYAKLN